MTSELWFEGSASALHLPNRWPLRGAPDAGLRGPQNGPCTSSGRESRQPLCWEGVGVLGPGAAGDRALTSQVPRERSIWLSAEMTLAHQPPRTLWLSFSSQILEGCFPKAKPDATRTRPGHLQPGNQRRLSGRNLLSQRRAISTGLDPSSPWTAVSDVRLLPNFASPPKTSFRGHSGEINVWLEEKRPPGPEHVALSRGGRRTRVHLAREKLIGVEPITENASSRGRLRCLWSRGAWSRSATRNPASRFRPLRDPLPGRRREPDVPGAQNRGGFGAHGAKPTRPLLTHVR